MILGPVSWYFEHGLKLKRPYLEAIDYKARQDELIPMGMKFYNFIDKTKFLLDSLFYVGLVSFIWFYLKPFIPVLIVILLYLVLTNAWAAYKRR